MKPFMDDTNASDVQNQRHTDHRRRDGARDHAPHHGADDRKKRHRDRSSADADEKRGRRGAGERHPGYGRTRGHRGSRSCRLLPWPRRSRNACCGRETKTCSSSSGPTRGCRTERSGKRWQSSGPRVPDGSRSQRVCAQGRNNEGYRLGTYAPVQGDLAEDALGNGGERRDPPCAHALSPARPPVRARGGRDHRGNLARVGGGDPGGGSGGPVVSRKDARRRHRETRAGADSARTHEGTRCSGRRARCARCSGDRRQDRRSSRRCCKRHRRRRPRKSRRLRNRHRERLRASRACPRSFDRGAGRL